MPLDHTMRDGTTFDPNNPRISYDGPPRLPPIDLPPVEEPMEPDRWENGKRGNTIWGEVVLLVGYIGSTLLCTKYAPASVAITAVTQTLGVGSAYVFLNEPEFANTRMRRWVDSHGPQSLKNWHNHSVLKKSVVASFFALSLSIPTDQLLSSQSRYALENGPSLSQVAREIVGRGICSFVAQFPNSGIRNLYCASPIPR
jgi:hypothetical protein